MFSALYYGRIKRGNLSRKPLLTAAQCWINVAYEADRLWSHYIWIFIFEFGTVLMYVSIAFKLRKHLRFFKSVSGRSSTLERQQKYMMIYPTIYVILTLPLAASRMWSMAHHGKAASDAVMITAGCLITSCGWMDSLMYSLTRNVLASRSTPRNGTAGYGSHGTGPRPGAAPVAGRNRTRYEFDDLTILRSYGDWDGDGDTTPPGTTTMIVGGKEVGGDVRNYSRQADRAKVNKTKRNCSPPSNGRSNSKNPFSRHGSNNKHGTRVTEEELRPVSEGDEKLIDSQKDELVLPIQRPGMAARGESGRSSPMRLSPPLDEPYYVARAQSPASDETRVPSGDHGYPLPPGSPAFGQVRIEKSITVTSSEAADHV